MDVRRTVNEFICRSRELSELLRSSERIMLDEVDLHTLRVQLHLLDGDAVILQNSKRMQLKDRQEESKHDWSAEGLKR